MIHDVAGDGNCLFRALADQLYNAPERHAEVRTRIMQHIEAHADDFAPFVEDDEPFEKYCRSMRKAGTWGGNIELQAASVCFQVNVHIYQLGLPRWDVVNHPAPARALALSYHTGDHYNSVRPLERAAASVLAAPPTASAAARVVNVPAAPAPADNKALDKAARSRQFQAQARAAAAAANAAAAPAPASSSADPTAEELALMQVRVRVRRMRAVTLWLT